MISSSPSFFTAIVASGSSTCLVPLMRYVAWTVPGFFPFCWRWNSYNILLTISSCTWIGGLRALLLCCIDMDLEGATEETVGNLRWLVSIDRYG